MPGDFTLVPAFASIRDESPTLLHMPTPSTDKSQIYPGNHKASIIHAGLLLGFPSLLKPVVSGLGVCVSAHKHEPEAQFHLKEGGKKSMLSLMESRGSRNWRINNNDNFQRTKISVAIQPGVCVIFIPA